MGHLQDIRSANYGHLPALIAEMDAKRVQFSAEGYERLEQQRQQRALHAEIREYNYTVALLRYSILSPERRAYLLIREKHLRTELLTLTGVCECGCPGYIRIDCPEHGQQTERYGAW